MKNAILQTAETETGASTPMPLYQSHKKVWALKIAKFERRKPTIEELNRILNETPADGDGIGGFITPADKGYARFAVSSEYVQKHDPQEGGYFVQYEDGYCSWSPAEAFESGYTRVWDRTYSAQHSGEDCPFEVTHANNATSDPKKGSHE